MKRRITVFHDRPKVILPEPVQAPAPVTTGKFWRWRVLIKIVETDQSSPRPRIIQCESGNQIAAILGLSRELIQQPVVFEQGPAPQDHYGYTRWHHESIDITPQPSCGCVIAGDDYTFNDQWTMGEFSLRYSHYIGIGVRDWPEGEPMRISGWI